MPSPCATASASRTAAAWLAASFPGRFTLVAGDTTQTLQSGSPALEGLPRCDVVSIDGGHHYAVASSDLQKMSSLVSKRHALVMDDLRCGHHWCKAPTLAWRDAQRAGLVREAGCHILSCCVGWCWGRFGK